MIVLSTQNNQLSFCRIFTHCLANAAKAIDASSQAAAVGG
jgi:hypothetical protein